MKLQPATESAMATGAKIFQLSSALAKLRLLFCRETDKISSAKLSPISAATLRLANVEGSRDQLAILISPLNLLI